MVPPLDRHRRFAPQERHDDLCVLDEPPIALVMLRLVAEGQEIVSESTRHHVQVHLPTVEVGERRDQLRDRVGMHIHGLHRDQRAQALGALDDYLRHEPRIDQAVVGVDEDSGASCAVAPSRHVTYRGDVTGAVHRRRRWTRRVDPHNEPSRLVARVSVRLVKPSIAGLWHQRAQCPVVGANSPVAEFNTRRIGPLPLDAQIPLLVVRVPSCCSRSSGQRGILRRYPKT